MMVEADFEAVMPDMRQLEGVQFPNSQWRAYRWRPRLSHRVCAMHRAGRFVAMFDLFFCSFRG
jgi:hypothetical protein